MKRTNLLSIFLVLVFILSGCTQDENPVATEVAPVKVIRVESLQVEPRDLVENFTLPGSLEAWKDLILAAEIAGAVERVGAEEGERVMAGEELVRIDTLTLQTNLSSARADFELRQKTERRLKRLIQEQLVSTQEYENADGALDIAAASLRSAEVMLAKGILKSPIEGLLEERYVDPGEYVGLGDPLVRIVQVDRLKVNVDVPEKDIQYLQKGDSVTIDGSEINGWGYGSLQGKISLVGYVADPLTRTYRVQIEIENRNTALRPGMIVRTRFTRRQLNQVLVVPLYAVVDRDGQKYLFIKNGDNARQQKVLLGAILSGEVVVREGLHAGDEVVVKGQQLLLDGALISSGEKQ